MKPALFFLWLLTLSLQGSPASAATDDFDPNQFVAQKSVLVLGSYADFHEARQHALALSRASRMPFSLRGMIYDKKRGLIVPDDDSDGVYAGFYISRRYNTARLHEHEDETKYLSVERSDAYEGFRKGYYIIVGGIYDDDKEAGKARSRFRPFVAAAYAKKTKIYLGCLH